MAFCCFSSSVVSFDVPEDTSRGARVGALRAFDADDGANGQVSFSLLSDWGNDLFALNPHTGVFTLTAGLDYEQVGLLVHPDSGNIYIYIMHSHYERVFATSIIHISMEVGKV